MQNGSGTFEAVHATLAERERTYGDFEDNAEMAQRLKSVMRTGEAWCRLDPDQREALEMIASKVSRIVTGDPNHVDSWHDVSGYATLVERRLTGK